MVVVAVGHAFEGIKLYGPFKNAEEADEWAATEVTKDPWWIVPVEEP